MILGHHSAAELVDMLAAKDYFHRQLSAAFAVFRTKWAQADPQAFAAFSDDFEQNAERYRNARAAAAAVIDTATKRVAQAQKVADVASYGSFLPVQKDLVSMAKYPTEDEWVALLASDRAVPNQISKGDFYDLDARLRTAATAAGFRAGIPDYSATPQPRASSDAELTSLRDTSPEKLAANAADTVNAVVDTVAEAEKAVNAVTTATAGALGNALKDMTPTLPDVSFGTKVAVSAGVTGVVLLAGWIAFRVTTAPIRAAF